MKVDNLVKESEKLMKSNLPKTRSKKGYLAHVEGVRKYALKLAKIYNADKLVVEVAALLHDIGADVGEDHANESAKISKKFLSKFEVSSSFKKHVIECIGRHSMGSKTETMEERVIQDADGIMFLNDTYKIFFEKRKQKFSLDEAKKKTIEKIRGMMNKIKTKEGIKIAEKSLKKAISDVKDGS